MCLNIASNFLVMNTLIRRGSVLIIKDVTQFHEELYCITTATMSRSRDHRSVSVIYVFQVEMLSKGMNAMYQGQMQPL